MRPFHFATFSVLIALGAILPAASVLFADAAPPAASPAATSSASPATPPPAPAKIPPVVVAAPKATVLPKEPTAWDPPKVPALDPTELVGPFVLVDESLPQVVALYEKVSGKIVLRTQVLPVLKINFNSPVRIPRGEAVSALETLLSLNGVNITPVPNGPFMKATLNTFASQDAPPLYNDAAEVEKLAPSEHFISRLYVFKNIPASFGVAPFTSLVNKARGDTLTLFLPGNAILFVSTVANIKRAEIIFERLDAENSVAIYKLQHIRASELKHKILLLNAGKKPLWQILGGDFTLDADDVSNTVMVVTEKNNHAKLKELIEQFDKADVTMKTYVAKHVRASELRKTILGLAASAGTAVGPGGRPVVAAGAARSILRNVLLGDFVLEADDATSQLFVITQPDNHPKIADLIALLDKNEAQLRYYDVKYIKAADIKKYIIGLQNAISAPPPKPGVVQNKDILRNLLGGDFLIEANEAANKIIVIASPVVLDKIGDIIREMDVNTTELMVFRVKHLKASKIKRLLETLRTGKSSDGVAVAQRPGTVAPNAMQNILGGDITIDADDFGNQLIVAAHPKIREKIQQLIEQLDKDGSSPTTSEIVGLKHSEVENTVRALSVIVTGKSGGLLQVEGGMRVSANSRGITNFNGVATSVNSYRTFSFTNRNETQSTNPQFAKNNAVAAAGSANSFSEFVTVSGDERTNRVMLFGTADDIKQLKEIIAKLDTPLPQVRIEAVVVEVTLTNGEASGLDTLGLGYKAVPNAGMTAGKSDVSAPEYNIGATTPVTPGTTTSPFSITGSLRDFSLSVLFGEAEHNERVRILSAPLINTSHNQPATVFVGEEYPVISSTTSDLSNATSTRSTYEFKQIGLSLSVTPRVGANGSVEMKVDQNNQEVAREVTIDNNKQPVTSTRSASAYLIANDNETVVLAGLQRYREIETSGVVWLLGHIPLIGHIFQPETKNITRTEIIIFLKPHILNSSDTVDSLPGLRPGSLTRPDAKSYLGAGRFNAVSLTDDEREVIDEIRRRQSSDAEKTRKN